MRPVLSKTWSKLLLLAACVIAPQLRAEVQRVVIIKVDGLPERLIERYAAESGQGVRKGRSRLPWIDQVFGKNGAWLENFYVRGLSLSAPSWSMLDTGRHLEVRGNAEYDRYTLNVWDHLNFFPFYLAYGFSKMADMPGVDEKDVEVTLKSGMLTIEGMVTLDMYRNLIPVYTEYNIGNYFRQFVVNDDIDAARIEARIRNGVLEVSLPKAETARPRRIDVQAG